MDVTRALGNLLLISGGSFDLTLVDLGINFHNAILAYNERFVLDLLNYDGGFAFIIACCLISIILLNSNIFL